MIFAGFLLPISQRESNSHAMNNEMDGKIVNAHDIVKKKCAKKSGKNQRLKNNILMWRFLCRVSMPNKYIAISNSDGILRHRFLFIASIFMAMTIKNLSMRINDTVCEYHPKI